MSLSQNRSVCGGDAYHRNHSVPFFLSPRFADLCRAVLAIIMLLSASVAMALDSVETHAGPPGNPVVLSDLFVRPEPIRSLLLVDQGSAQVPLPFFGLNAIAATEFKAEDYTTRIEWKCYRIFGGDGNPKFAHFISVANPDERMESIVEADGDPEIMQWFPRTASLGNTILPMWNHSWYAETSDGTGAYTIAVLDFFWGWQFPMPALSFAGKFAPPPAASLRSNGEYSLAGFMWDSTAGGSLSLGSTRYKFRVYPGLTGSLNWMETWHPSDNSGVRYVAKEWEIPFGATETEVFTLNGMGDGMKYGLAGLLLFDVRIGVDANRDGRVVLPGASDDPSLSDATTADKPFRFWLNDDIDRNKIYTYADQLPGFIQAPASLIPGALAVQEVEQDDLPVTSASDQNWNNSVIDCERDLEDFARLWIYTSGLNESFKNGQLSLGLKWTDVSSGNPAIRLFKHAESDGGTKYLTDPATAHQQIDQTGAAYGLALGIGLVEGSTPFVLPQSVFANLSDSAPKTYLLFEGCKAGKGQLKLVILKPKGDGTYDTIGEGPGVWMELKEPHEFIERWSCGDGDRSDVQSVVRENSNSASPAWGSPTTDEEKDYILYVHGYNMKEFEKQRWIETTFKRLYWLGYKGRVGGFSWPCSQSAPPFDESEEKAWQSAGQLTNLLASLKAAGYRVHVMAHSQGNIVAGEALRQAGADSALTRTYIASQAAIPAHCYASNVLLIPDFEDSSSDDHTPNVYLNYPPASAPYMGVAAMQGAAGRYANFYNISDYALTGNSAIAPIHPGWEIDQRWKPNQGFTYNIVDGFLETTATGFLMLTMPNDRFRIFSYCAEARSKALGTMPTGGVFTNFTNLQSSLSYGSEHIYHSAQFRGYYADRYQYWRSILRTVDLQPLLP